MPDWRISTAQRIKGATLRFKKYTRWSDVWEHEHCVGCWAKFMETKVSPEILTEGYVTKDDHWVCPECFGDLREIMEWKLAA